MHKVVIIGAGFAGLNAAKELANDKKFSVVLIDRKNHHLFQPLLYQVATAGLNPGDIAVPIRAQFSHAKNVEVHWADVCCIHLQKKLVETTEGFLKYDSLILACGAMHSYFNHPEWEPYAPGLKTLEQATEIRRRMLAAFEHAENSSDLEKQKAYLTFVIVGGGPTGVELAGAIADIRCSVLADDFRQIDPRSARVILVEAGERVLASFDPKLSAHAHQDLEKIGVEIRTKSRVTHIDENGVRIGDEKISAKTVFWAAGVQAAKLEIVPEVPHDKAGRVEVLPDLTVPKHPDVFVIGDMAHVKQADGSPVPGLAPAAIQQGKYAARNLKNRLQSKTTAPFRYKDKGQLATIGKKLAVLQIGKIKMTGRLAWIAWLLVHLFFLIGFKNRLFVVAQWIWSYVFSKRGARLITDVDWRLGEQASSR